MKTIEKVIRLCTVLNFFLSGSFEDMAIFHVIQLIYDGGGALCAHYRSLDKGRPTMGEPLVLERIFILVPIHNDRYFTKSPKIV